VDRSFGHPHLDLLFGWDEPVWSPDSQWIAIGTCSHEVILINVHTGLQLRLKHDEKNVRQPSWDPTGKLLMVSSDWHRPGWFSDKVCNFTHIWEVSSGKKLMTLPSGDSYYTRSWDWSPDGRYLAWNDTRASNLPQIYCVYSGEKISELSVNQNISKNEPIEKNINLG
jgi:WD40 repeat protein